MRRLHWVPILAAGGLLLGLMAGCTPKPSEEQLQLLSRTCASAAEAERSANSAQRTLNEAERTLAQKRQTLAERQRYQQQVRANLESM